MASFLIAAFLFGLVGAYLYRLRGRGTGIDLPRPIEQAVFSLPILTIVFLDVPVWATGLSYIWYVAWVCTGHGGFMDLANSVKNRSLERLEPLIRWLYTILPEYWYDALGLALTGIVPMVLPAMFVGWYCSWLAAFYMLLIGCTKAIAYMVGRKYDFTPWSDWPTERGEYLTGFFVWYFIPLILLLYGVKNYLFP